MTLNISVPTSTQELRPKITVIGVGGAGGNAVNNMIAADLEGVDFLVANTDGQALAGSLAERKIQLGRAQTQGLGAGSQPEVGRIAAEESLDDIMAELADSHMVFITAGMGGGTGTGAAPVIAKAARERGILTVGVVTKPFDFEGQKRMGQANTGIEELQAYVDTLIIIPNQNLFRLANERTTFADAFAMADEVLHKGVCGVTDLMVKPGNINLDFADIRTVMSEMGKAMMGTGEASGENRATNAAEAAINNPLLDETTMKGAQAVLINITGGKDMTLFEVDEAANHIRREVDNDATIIFGSAHDDRLEGVMRVSVVATGMEAHMMSNRPDNSQSLAAVATSFAEKRPKPSVEAAPVMQAPVMETPMMETSVMETETMTDDASWTDSLNHSEEDIPFDLTDTVASEDNAVSEDSIDDAPQSDANDDFIMKTDAETQAEDTSLQDTSLEDTSSEDAPLEDVKDEDEALKADEPAPFVMRPAVEIPEDTATAEEQDGPKSLIGHLSRMMFSSKSSASEDAQDKATASEPTLEPVDAPRISTAETVNLVTPEEISQTEASDIRDENTDDMFGDNTEQEVSGIASLKPTSQPQLDIAKAGEDVDLDIPAFLRRQAN